MPVMPLILCVGGASSQIIIFHIGVFNRPPNGVVCRSICFNPSESPERENTLKLLRTQAQAILTTTLMDTIHINKHLHYTEWE